MKAGKPSSGTVDEPDQARIVIDMGNVTWTEIEQTPDQWALVPSDSHGVHYEWRRIKND